MNYVVREVSDVQGDAVDPEGFLYIDKNLSGVEPGYTKVSTCTKYRREIVAVRYFESIAI